jgi:hypothetical protein
MRDAFNLSLRLSHQHREKSFSMRITQLKKLLPVVALAIVFCVANVANGQEYVKRLRNPAAVKGLIGGESHNSYVIRVRKGQTLTVQISWKHEHDVNGDNHAEFFVSDLPNFASATFEFGKEFNNGKRWTGTVPKTGDYYIYVNAYPTAYYSLRAAVR